MLKKNARRVIDWYIANGVLRVRTHADCTDPTLVTVESLLELKDEVKDLIDIQVVAFPQNGIYTDPSYKSLLEESIKIEAWVNALQAAIRPQCTITITITPTS